MALHFDNPAARATFLRHNIASIYARLTDDGRRFVRAEQLVREAAEVWPGLVPSPNLLAEEADRPLKAKLGLEIDQALLLAQILADPACGAHLCHAMLLPRPEAQAALTTLAEQGAVDLGPVRVERHGKAVHLISQNPRYLNAEDQTTIDAMEIGVDVATLDPGTEIAVLRGGPVAHPKYAGRRIFGSGINLTHLYQGRIPLLWYLQRDLGFVHKYFRGVATPDALPDDVSGFGIEKALDRRGGDPCHRRPLPDPADHGLRAGGSGRFMTLPARKEGIIPGLANLRLPRFVGDRIARQAIMAERRLECDSDAGRLICDEIVPPGGMDAAIERIVALLSSAGAVGAIGNRRALRVGAEPLDLFRRYCAVYAREQAACHFSRALIDNLEQNWGAGSRT